MKRLVAVISVVLAIFTALGMSWHRRAVQPEPASFSSQEPTPMPTPSPTPSPSPSPSGTATPYPEPTPTVTPLKGLSAGVSLKTAGAAPSHAEGRRYRLDAAQSKFIAHAMAGGLLWFKGHDHLVAVREFTGEAQLTRDQANGSSLEINAKAASMVESSTVFTDQQKQIIDKELREIVLQPEQYPDIVFRSTQVGVKKSAADQYDLDVTGNLTLHGVTRQITIPTKVTVTASDLRAVGEFSIDRSDFNVKATSAFHGLVRVRDKVKFNFDIVGHQL